MALNKMRRKLKWVVYGLLILIILAIITAGIWIYQNAP